MSNLAEIEHAVETLPAAEQETLYRFLAARLETKSRPGAAYRTRTRPGGLLIGVDPDKLGQLPEEL